MNILEEIIAHKHVEVAQRKAAFPTSLLEKSPHFQSPVVSLSQHVKRSDLSGIIAEIKRKSPSQGDIHPLVDVARVSTGYVQAGASALSILTDETFFGGSNADLSVARKLNACPILRKDFVIDEYQIIEARAIGADAILLIAACLSPEVIREMAGVAQRIGLEVLLEVHSEAELDRSLCDEVQLIGVNNRDLRTFRVDVETSLALVNKIPSSFTKVTESGLSDPAQVIRLREAGFEGFLMGQKFMESSQPEVACAEFIAKLRELQLG